jgi:hypothetical protein
MIVAAQIERAFARQRKARFEVSFRGCLVAKEMPGHAVYQFRDRKAGHVLELLRCRIPFSGCGECAAEVGDARQEHMPRRQHTQPLGELIERAGEFEAACEGR